MWSHEAYKNLLCAKGREYGKMLSQESLSFSPFEVVFWVILHQTCVVITCNFLVATIQIQLATAILSYSYMCVIAGWDEVPVECL